MISLSSIWHPQYHCLYMVLHYICKETVKLLWLVPHRSTYALCGCYKIHQGELKLQTSWYNPPARLDLWVASFSLKSFCMYLLNRGIGDLILVYKRVASLAGHTSRVAELLEQVNILAVWFWWQIHIYFECVKKLWTASTFFWDCNKSQEAILFFAWKVAPFLRFSTWYKCSSGWALEFRRHRAQDPLPNNQFSSYLSPWISRYLFCHPLKWTGTVLFILYSSCWNHLDYFDWVIWGD